MKEKFEEWGDNAPTIVEGFANFLPQHETNDDVYKCLFMEAENVMVQELLQIIFKSFAATVQHLLLDHLPGGIYHSVAGSNNI